jgi:hypothetical protein
MNGPRDWDAKLLCNIRSLVWRIGSELTEGVCRMPREKAVALVVTGNSLIPDRVALQTFNILAARFAQAEIPQHVIERSVLHHHDDDGLDFSDLSRHLETAIAQPFLS